jgi:flagellin-like hook-associated protein FlgL
MANLTNPVTDVARFAMKDSSRRIGLAGEQIATGKRGPSDIVDYVIGSKLRNNATVLSSVSKNVNYGINMLKNAQSALESVKNKLTEMKKLIAQANTAFGPTLERLDALYRDNSKEVVRLLDSASYDGRKLFDGSLTTPRVLALQQESIPANASPLSIRVGEDINNIISIVIPKLLAGTGIAVGPVAVADIPVPNRFTPIFPITQQAAAAITAINAAAQVGGANAGTIAADGAVGVAQADPIGAMVVEDAIAAATAGAAADAIAASIVASRSCGAGNLANQANQNFASGIMDRAFDIVTSLVSSIGGQLANLQHARDDVNSSIKVQNEAADSYLNTNYEEASRDFKNALLAMRGSISITTQGYRVAEAALNLIEG